MPSLPLAYNTKNGAPLAGAGVFMDTDNHWYSIQGRSTHDGSGSISFVCLRKRPEWLTGKDVSDPRIAMSLQLMLNGGNVKIYRTQDEADEDFKKAHRERRFFVDG